ncbi:MAG: tryptophan--tRNA ligase [Candidatus Nomurabacteria bacterium]|jgi:tryptophanyl-tRNA synthetase|nr:tryptophan--tRNA ligase [Candidatus Nomurabacteria bacterium]
MNEKPVVLTGDRPTGPLHLGHLVGSLASRVELQNSGKYQMFVMIADQQALTDNARDPRKIHDNLLNVALDYLSVGLDPAQTCIFVQSQVPALYELTIQYQNFVSLARVERNPTVKSEIQQRGFSINSDCDDESQSRQIGVPVGFLTYPIAQAADVTAFAADIVPVGEDQLPVMEMTGEIVRTFNRIYGNILKEPKAVVPDSAKARRLPGIYGVDDKMSKSLDNGIYLSDPPEIVKAKVMKMFTDPGHIHIDDPGRVDGNVAFYYLDVFSDNPKKVAQLKADYQKGGLGDVEVKKYLIEVLEKILAPIRDRRAKFAGDLNGVKQMLAAGSEKANQVASQTLARVRAAIGLNYFES